MYKARLEQLDVSVIHTSRLKTRLLAVIPDLQAHSQGRDVLLTFDVGNAIKIACDHDSNAMLRAGAKESLTKSSTMIDHSSLIASKIRYQNLCCLL